MRLLARRPLRPRIERSVFPLRMFAKARDEFVSHVLTQQVQIRAHTEAGKERTHDLMIFLGPLDLGRVLGFQEREYQPLLGFEMSEDAALEIAPVMLDRRLIRTLNGVLELAEDLLQPPVVTSQKCVEVVLAAICHRGIDRTLVGREASATLCHGVPVHELQRLHDVAAEPAPAGSTFWKGSCGRWLAGNHGRCP